MEVEGLPTHIPDEIPLVSVKLYGVEHSVTPVPSSYQDNCSNYETESTVTSQRKSDITRFNMSIAKKDHIRAHTMPINDLINIRPWSAASSRKKLDNAKSHHLDPIIGTKPLTTIQESPKDRVKRPVSTHSSARELLVKGTNKK